VTYVWVTTHTLGIAAVGDC